MSRPIPIHEPSDSDRIGHMGIGSWPHSVIATVTDESDDTKETPMNQHNPSNLIAALMPLARIFPGKATRRWLSKTAWTIWRLESLGATHFGGPEVLAEWLVQRCRPKAPPTKARVRTLVKMAGGSQKTLDMLVAVEERYSTPRRHAIGWSFLEVNSYLTCLVSERFGTLRG